jgi:hypothetical protein
LAVRDITGGLEDEIEGSMEAVIGSYWEKLSGKLGALKQPPIVPPSPALPSMRLGIGRNGHVPINALKRARSPFFGVIWTFISSGD